ncbi:hypothetical protein [Azospirillum argentinense]
MPLQNKYVVGETWVLPEGSFIFIQELPGAQMLLRPERTPAGAVIQHMIKTEAEFDLLRDARLARRIHQFCDKNGRLQRCNDAGEVPPEGANPKDRARQFFVRKWDEAPCGTGEAALRRLIAYHAPEARSLGLAWVPSPSTLKRAIHQRGGPGRRPLRVMQDMRGRQPRDHWPAMIAEALERTVAWYYAKDTRNRLDAHAWLVRLVNRVNKMGRVRHGAQWQKLPCPSDETVRRYILKAANLTTYTAKWGATEGRRRFQGVRLGMQAKQILDVVLIDSTVADSWCVLDDETRTPAGRPTITLAIDLKSRAVLGVIITYEGESLFAIMACLQQVISGKRDVIERLPRFKPLLDGLYGKPDTVVVDNAWRQTGVSFQDACEDGNINVEWAPVKNPEYKAHVERFFRTLNDILLKKMPGGVPFDPAMMRKLGLDPRETAAITRSRLEELIYEAIYEVYSQEVHSGINTAPLLAWRKGLAATPREIVDDLDFLAAAFGVVDEATLDRRGITFRNMQFHDPAITTALLNDLASTTPVRQQRKRHGSATARVKIKYNPADARGIWVWNPQKKPKRGYVFLPNWDARYAATPGLGFWHHDQIRAFANAENLAFRSDEDKCLARDRLRAQLEAAAPDLKYAAMRTQRRLLDPALPILAGDTVQMAQGVPSVSGMTANDVLVEVAAKTREDGGHPEKGSRRGGAKASRTASTRRKAATAKPPAPTITGPGPSDTPFAPPDFTVNDPSAYMAGLAQRFAERRPGPRDQEGEPP